MAPPPTPEQWVELRPVVTRWYLGDQRTARWIETEVRKSYGLCVTTKMLRDRFKAWNLQPKYNKSKNKQPNSDSVTNRAVLYANGCKYEPSDTESRSTTTELSNYTEILSNCAMFENIGSAGSDAGILRRSPDIAPENWTLVKALKGTQDYYSNLVDRIQRNCVFLGDLDQDQAFEVQRLAAKAHQAMASQMYSSHQTFADLQDVGARATQVLPALSINSMHPRVLTVMLRLVVESLYGCVGGIKERQEVDILRTVKALFKQISTSKLSADHPVSLLCAIPNQKSQTDQLLHYQMTLVKSELYDKIRPYDTQFVALERIYSARVLASLGLTAEAEDLLEEAFRDNLADYKLFVHADACRTLGYTKLRAGTPDQAVLWLRMALDEFRRSDNGRTENVLYTHFALSSAYRQLGELQLCEQSLWDAVMLWKSEESLQRNSTAVKFIRDLDQVLVEQEKFDAQAKLREEFATYFEDVRDQA